MTATPRDLLQRLFEYIEEQAKEIDPRGFQLSKQNGFRRSPGDIAGLPGVSMDLQLEGDHVWLRVDRLEASKPPAVPPALQGLCKPSSDPAGHLPALDEAALLHRIHAESDKPADTRADKADKPADKLAEKQAAKWTDTPENERENQRVALEARIRAHASEALREYTGLWKSWAEGEKPRWKTISLYGDIFALKHQLEAEETVNPTELVWGVGVATWSMRFKGDTFPFAYPVLTQAVEISLNEQTMAIEVRPRAMDTRVEMAPFVACQVPGAADVEKAVREHLAKHKDHPVTPFDPSSYSDVLKLAATILDSKGLYKPILGAHEAVPPAGQHLVVIDTWVLFSRPRANNYLVEDLKRLRDRIAGGCDIPAGSLALVSPPSGTPVEYEAVNFRGISSRGSYEGGGQPQELYFPLPYNSEQVTIVQRLERAAGVTVQGPPGTGKTHTIANIICHYLATGRRVLVTSRGEPALEVLQSKIPEEVRDLTVALLTSDREGVRQFQASIEAIQHQVSQINPEGVREQLGNLRQAIDRAHSELSTIDRRVDEIAVDQLSEIEVDGAPMRAQKLAELVVHGQEDFAWFDDRLSLSPEQAPPLMESEAGALRESRRQLGSDLAYVSAAIPFADGLPNPTDIAELHNVLSQMKKLDGQVENGQLLPLKGLTTEVLQAARELLAVLDEALAIAEELEVIGGGWPMELRVRCREPSFASERQALEMLFSDVDHLVQARAEFLIKPIEFPSKGLTNPKVLEAVARAVKTGKPFGLLSFGAGDAKDLLSSIRVAGLPPNGNRDWEHIQRYIALHGRVTSFLARWNQFADTLLVPQLSGGVEYLREIEMVAVAARKAHTFALTYDATLPGKAEAVFERVPAAELISGSSELKGIRKHLISHLTRAELSSAATKLSTLQEKLAGKTGPVSDELRAFVDQELGNPSFEASRVAARFAELGMELRRIAGLAADLACVRDSASRLEKSGASKLATRVRTLPVASTGEDTVFPASWRQAWQWARMKSHLDSIEAREELMSLAARRRDLEGGLSKLYKDMVSKAAWLATKLNATPKVLQALAGYATAIRKIGMGTGPNAVRYRRDARESMLDAAGAVPCWIMSHAKISESMPPDIGAFDLVIVDEASQSDLWALPAIVRGKKILVVGDDKQVSPDAGFTSSQRIDELKHRFLEEQPYGIEMTPEKSLYELAARVFAAEQVMLREHFRCVPPIIAYSNRTFYKNGIQPLRIPKASERIDPPLVDIYVPGGVRNRHGCNVLEAKAIAEEIAAILDDKQHAGRTLGVVSLLGMEQAKHIDEVVRARCPAAELMHRKFECGDARVFQGSERDIMFLSMVVDTSRNKAVSGNMFEQRFNVAASRARDRMYLVRSVTEVHLSDKDLRLTLLRYFDKPLIAESSDASHLIDQCESGFERDVYSHLTKAGYRVIPQVKSGAYRIDMVVEGAGDTRLAVECDGDEYHGPDRWQQDMNRQRVLERAGWTFWRCFASTWSLRKEEIFGELVEQLGAMGIEPLGALDRAPSLVEKRVWKPAAAEGGEADAEAETSASGTAGTAGTESLELKGQTNEEIIAAGKTAKERELEEQRIKQEERKAKEEADKAELGRVSKQRAGNPDNFVFGESAQDAASLTGNLFTSNPGSKPALAPNPVPEPAPAPKEEPDTGEQQQDSSPRPDKPRPAPLPPPLPPKQQPAKKGAAGKGKATTKPSGNPDAAKKEQAKQALKDTLADIVNFAAKNVKKNMMPEREEKILPLLTKAMDAAFELGYIKFKEAARFVLDTIQDRISKEVADDIALRHLQGAYVQMSGRHEGQASDIAEIFSVKSLDEIMGDENVTDGDSGTDLEPDSGDTETTDGVGEEGIPDDRGGNGEDGGPGIPVNAGIDPEMMQAGITLAGYHIEKGARTFAGFARAMVDDLGETVKPYLKSWYAAIKFDHRSAEFSSSMDSMSAIEAANVNEITGEKNVDDGDSGANLEPDSEDAEIADGVGEVGVSDDRGGIGEDGGPGISGTETEGGMGSRGGVSGREAAPDGEQSDNSIYSGKTGSGTEGGTSGNQLDQSSDTDSFDGQANEPDTTEAIKKAATGGVQVEEKQQEQELLPILTRLMDATFNLGYYKFKEAARFVIDTIRDAAGQEMADVITLKHLQGVYIGMSGKYEGQASDIMEVASVKSLEEITGGENVDDRRVFRLEGSRNFTLPLYPPSNLP